MTAKRGTVVPATWQERFLAALRKGGNVSAAAKAAKVSRNFVYEQRESDPDFKAAWAAALDEAVDGLEAEAWRRAARGVLKPVFYKGGAVGHIREYSDGLLQFLLRGHRPERFRERAELDVNVQGAVTLYLPDNGRTDHPAPAAGAPGTVPGDTG